MSHGASIPHGEVPGVTRDIFREASRLNAKLLYLLVDRATPVVAESITRA